MLKYGEEYLKGENLEYLAKKLDKPKAVIVRWLSRKRLEDEKRINERAILQSKASKFSKIIDEIIATNPAPITTVKKPGELFFPETRKFLALVSSKIGCDAYIDYSTAAKLAVHLNETRSKILRWFDLQRQKVRQAQQRRESNKHFLKHATTNSEDFENIQICDITRENLLDDQTPPCYSDESIKVPCRPCLYKFVPKLLCLKSAMELNATIDEWIRSSE